MGANYSICRVLSKADELDVCCNGQLCSQFCLPRAGSVALWSYHQIRQNTFLYLGTLIVDRLFDVVAMAFIMLLCLLLDFNFFSPIFKPIQLWGRV